MSNPARAPREYTADQLARSVAPDAFLPEGFASVSASFRKLETAQSLLEPLDMRVEKSILLPRDLVSVDAVRNSSKPAMALARQGVPVARIRSAVAKDLVNATYAKLPDTGFGSRAAVGGAMSNRVFVEGGTNATLGRIAKAYPRKGSVPSHPITRVEARMAVKRCGIEMKGLPKPALRPYPLVAAEGQQTVMVNPHSDNGLPVLGKWSDPVAAKRCEELAATVREGITRTADVAAWKRLMEETQPWMVAALGKAKADYYVVEKIVGGVMRFYNVLPRQILLNMQMATQPFEANSRHIGQEGHSGIGITLTRGGAADLVAELQRQLDETGRAYVHVGDDSWVLMKIGERVVMFALDCSNFDLTQHGTVTKEVHAAIRDELALYDEAAADLWHAYARDRMVVVSGGLVRQFWHAGPSGMPLQSKVNDVLMDVMINRVLDRVGQQALPEEQMDALIKKVGMEMGFVVRVEQYWNGFAKSVVEALEQRPFLFIGYYFHVRGGQVQVCADIARTLAQVPYPAQKWAKTKEELLVREAMRLGSIALNFGIPPVELQEACDEFRAGARALVRRAIEQHGDVSDPKLRWAVQESPWGLTTEASLSGLLRALERDPAALWSEKEMELPSTSVLMPLSWADEVEEEEAAHARAFHATTARPAERKVKKLPVPRGVATTHPVTRANDGRPPPTAVWGPPKQPRASASAQPSRRERRRDGMARREFTADLENEWGLTPSDEEWLENE